MQDVLDPIITFKRLLTAWWKIVLIATLGGLIGLLVSLIRPPKFQAEATIHASIDFTQINFENLVGQYDTPVIFTQYDEDLALQVVERVLLSTWKQAYQFANTLDNNLNQETFWEDQQIQRFLGRWQLRYRHQDPEIAQAIVNYWTDVGVQALREAQESGKAESFVIIDLVSEAELPVKPIYHSRASLIIAGMLVGLAGGIILVDFSGRYLTHKNKEG